MIKVDNWNNKIGKMKTRWTIIVWWIITTIVALLLIKKATNFIYL